MEQHSLHKIPQMPKPMEQDVTMGLTYAINPVKARSDGGRVLELEFIAQDMEVKMGGNVMVNFDSKEIGSQGQLNPMMASFRKMIGSKLRFETDSAGKVERFVNLEEWKQSILGTGERPENFMFNQTYNEGYFRQLVDFAVGLPAQPIELGDTWPVTIELPAGMIGKIGVKLQNTFKGREDREQHACVAISFVGTLASAGGETTGPMGKLTVEDGQLTGTTWFDPKLGAMIETTSKQSMRLRGEFPGEPGVKGAQFTSDVMQTVAGKLVEVGK